MTSTDPITPDPLPPSVVDARTYTDPARFQRELETVFFTSWLPACLSADVAASRDYVVFEELGQSIVIVRGTYVSPANSVSAPTACHG